MLGGALEARRGRGEHTAEGARRLSGNGWRRSAGLKGRTGGWHRTRTESDYLQIPFRANRHAQRRECCVFKTRTVVNQPESEVRVSVLLLMRLHFRGSWPTTEFEKCRSRAVAALHPQVMAQCLRHTLPQRSGSSQRRSKIEELGPCEGKVEWGRVQTQHVCRDHQYPQAFTCV